MTDRGSERPFIAIGLVALVSLCVVQLARATGYLADRNLYMTLNIALPVLVLSMAYQVYLRRKRGNTVR